MGICGSKNVPANGLTDRKSEKELLEKKQRKLHHLIGFNRLQYNEIKFLQKMTNLDTATLQNVRALFEQYTGPDKRMNLATFSKVLDEAEIGQNHDLLKRLFEIFDKDQSGSIDFREYLCGLNMFVQHEPREMLKAAFQLFDYSGDGLITQVEMVKVLKTFKRTREFSAKEADQALGTPGPADAIEKYVQGIFVAYDKDSSASLDFDEFCLATVENPELVVKFMRPISQMAEDLQQGKN